MEIRKKKLPTVQNEKEKDNNNKNSAFNAHTHTNKYIAAALPKVKKRKKNFRKKTKPSEIKHRKKEYLSRFSI